MKIIDFLRKLLEVLWSVPTRLFGSRNERMLKHYSGAVAQINAMEPEIAKLSDADGAAKTGELQESYSEDEPPGQIVPQVSVVGAGDKDGKLAVCVLNLPCLATTGPSGI